MGFLAFSFLHFPAQINTTQANTFRNTNIELATFVQEISVLVFCNLKLLQTDLQPFQKELNTDFALSVLRLLPLSFIAS
jgi:hypothetical protein